jgi:zinc resistance-associated protein
MKLRLPLALAVAGLVGTGVVALAVKANADQDGYRSASSDEFHHYVPTPADRAAFLDARIAALHAGLQLTPDQEKLWPPVESAFRDAHKTITEERMKAMGESHPSDPIAWLQRLSEGETARGEALKKFADAAAPLYAALNDDQKHRFPILLRAIRPGAHFAMLGRFHGFGHGWRHDEDEHEDFDNDHEDSGSHDHDGDGSDEH